MYVPAGNESTFAHSRARATMHPSAKAICQDMRLAELHEVVYGNGNDLYCMKGFGDNHEAIKQFGFDGNKLTE